VAEKKKILLVDDEEGIQLLYREEFEEEGFIVDSAYNGDKALELFKEKQPDLVILDMIMPSGLDGLETYREMIRIRPGQKAIITSGFSESDRVRELQQLGAGKYLAKPYTLEQLCIAIRKALNKKNLNP